MTFEMGILIGIFILMLGIILQLSFIHNTLMDIERKLDK